MKSDNVDIPYTLRGTFNFFRYESNIALPILHVQYLKYVISLLEEGLLQKIFVHRTKYYNSLINTFIFVTTFDMVNY
jgi:hypothetical protein